MLCFVKNSPIELIQNVLHDKFYRAPPGALQEVAYADYETGRLFFRTHCLWGFPPRQCPARPGQEAKFDQITLSAQGGQTSAPTFRELAASLSQQVRTYNTTGRIQDLREQVASGSYRPDARETAARMLLMAEGE